MKEKSNVGRNQRRKKCRKKSELKERRLKGKNVGSREVRRKEGRKECLKEIKVEKRVRVGVGFEHVEWQHLRPTRCLVPRKYGNKCVV